MIQAKYHQIEYLVTFDLVTFKMQMCVTHKFSYHGIATSFVIM